MRRRSVADRLRDLAWRLSALVLGLGAWETVTRAGWVAPYILPAPTAIVGGLIKSWRLLLPHTLVTAAEILLGFLAAVIGGILLAVAVVYIRPFEKAVYPWIVASQAVPKVAIGPLFVLWMGFGLLPKVVIAFLIAFFPVMIDTVIGLRSVETESIYLLRSMGAQRWKTFIYLQVPHALPNIFGGMKVAITLATVGAIVGEFVGANDGLGYVLLFATGIFDTIMVFASLTLISVLAVVFYLAVGYLEDLFVGWHVSKRGELPSFTA